MVVGFRPWWAASADDHLVPHVLEDGMAIVEREQVKSELVSRIRLGGEVWYDEQEKSNEEVVEDKLVGGFQGFINGLLACVVADPVHMVGTVLLRPSLTPAISESACLSSII